MANTVIKVENLSKQYRLGEVGTGTISHDLNRWWHRIRGKEDPYLRIGESNDRSTKGNSEYVWALQDINFEVQQGDVLGIIGKNGAGKSTLLKILSKVTAPTTGSIKAKGRIASLLEVGTGFHPELTGRENIYLNGTILGMTKREVTAKMDEIVDFAGIERYLDTPVKRYSSGMMVRLGFAVAAHLEPEILIVDEVLAVGDAEFQKKAVGKMQEVSKEGGRTVLFVSHNMAALQNLCPKSVFLSNGTITEIDKTANIIDLYLTQDNRKFSTLEEITLRKGNGHLRFIEGVVRMIDSDEFQMVETFSDIFIILKFSTINTINVKSFRFDIGINNHLGERVAWISSSSVECLIDIYANSITFKIFNLPLAPGKYDCNLYCEINNELSDWLSNVLDFQVKEKDYYQTGKLILENQGDILLKYRIFQ